MDICWCHQALEQGEGNTGGEAGGLTPWQAGSPMESIPKLRSCPEPLTIKIGINTCCGQKNFGFWLTLLLSCWLRGEVDVMGVRALQNLGFSPLPSTVPASLELWLLSLEVSSSAAVCKTWLSVPICILQTPLLICMRWGNLPKRIATCKCNFLASVGHVPLLQLLLGSFRAWTGTSTSTCWLGGLK